MQAILVALWQVVVKAIIDLLDREDLVADEVEPVLETLDVDVDADALLARWGGLLDEDEDPLR